MHLKKELIRTKFDTMHLEKLLHRMVTFKLFDI
jgi:hypothetical protein